MKVAFVTPEIAPFSKTGGLADVSGALPRALEAQGAEVVTISPLYRSVARRGLEETPFRFQVPVGNSLHEAGVWRSGRNYFLRNDGFYDREGFYGTPQGDHADNASRFVFLCRGAMELLHRLGTPDILHANDWQTGLTAIYAKTLYAGVFPGMRTVFTIHNLGYQGIFPPSDLPLTGLDGKHFNWKELEFHGSVSFLKAGLVFADALTTVSPTYALDIQTPHFGCGMEGVLRERAGSLHGILNGVDYAEWDPGTDPHLAANYSPKSLAGKAVCKEALQERFGLPAKAEIPLVGMVTRLYEQKGIDLLAQGVSDITAERAQFVVLGSGEARYQEALRQVAARAPDRFAVEIAFDEALAHQVEAGSDLFLMPSRYEPCGLNQIYSLRYGTVPVVRATGGLADTVVDGVTGFTFGPYTPGALLEALRRAFRAFGDRKAWKKMVTAGMKRDFGWTESARRYLSLYRSLPS